MVRKGAIIRHQVALLILALLSSATVSASGNTHSYEGEPDSGRVIITLDDEVPQVALCSASKTTTDISEVLTAAGAGKTASLSPGGCKTVSGVASYYGEGDIFNGRTTASGRPMNGRAMTAAMRDFNAHLGLKGIFDAQVKCNNRTINLKVDDWGPHPDTGRVIDLSAAAAEACGFKKPGQRGGLGRVVVRICQTEKLLGAPASAKVASALKGASKPKTTIDKPKAFAEKSKPAANNAAAKATSTKTAANKKVVAKSSATNAKVETKTKVARVEKTPAKSSSDKSNFDKAALRALAQEGQSKKK